MPVIDPPPRRWHSLDCAHHISPQTTHDKVKKRTLALIQQWTGEFHDDPTLGIMEELYQSMKAKSTAVWLLGQCSSSNITEFSRLQVRRSHRSTPSRGGRHHQAAGGGRAPTRLGTFAAGQRWKRPVVLGRLRSCTWIVGSRVVVQTCSFDSRAHILVIRSNRSLQTGSVVDCVHRPRFEAQAIRSCSILQLVGTNTLGTSTGLFPGYLPTTT